MIPALNFCCRAQPQLNSISISIEAKVSLFSTLIQPPTRNRRCNPSQIKWCFWNTKILLSEYFKNTLRLLPNFFNTKNYFNTTLRLIKDSFRNISRKHSSKIQLCFRNTKTSLSAYLKMTSRLQDYFTTSSKIPTILRLIKDFFRSTSRQHWRC